MVHRINRGEKGLKVDKISSTIFKLDAKIIFIYDNDEYPVSSLEFAPYAGPQKIRNDRSKLLVERKALYNTISDLHITNEHAENLDTINVQIIDKI